MKKNIVLVVLLGLMKTTALFAAAGQIVTTGTDPGCYQFPNTGVQAAIKAAIDKGEEQCDGQAILRDLKVSIRQVGGCNPSSVKAVFVCLHGG